MNEEEREEMKRRCGGSWKLVLRFLLAGEACCRREKSQAIAGPGHSIAVTSKGEVYTFGYNNSGQLGHGHTDEEARILPVRYTSLSVSVTTKENLKMVSPRVVITVCCVQIITGHPDHSSSSWCWPDNANKRQWKRLLLWERLLR